MTRHQSLSPLDALVSSNWRPDLTPEARLVAIGLTILHGGNEKVAEMLADEQLEIAKTAGPQHAKRVLPRVQRAVADFLQKLEAGGTTPEDYLARCLREPGKRVVRRRRGRRRTFRRARRQTQSFE